MSSRRPTRGKTFDKAPARLSSGARTVNRRLSEEALEEEEVRLPRRRSARNRGRRGGMFASRKMSKEQSEWLFAGVVFVGLILAVVVGIHVIGGTSNTASANRARSSFFGSGGTGSRNSAVVSAVAGALNISTTTLTADLQSGQSVPQIAATQNVSITTVDSAYLSSVQQEFNAEVSSGRLSQSQANQIYSTQQQAVDNGQFPLLQFFANPSATATP